MELRLWISALYCTVHALIDCLISCLLTCGWFLFPPADLAWLPGPGLSVVFPLEIGTYTVRTTEPVFVNLLRSPGIDSQFGGRYNNPIRRTGPPCYIGWRNRTLGIDSWSPQTFTNTGSDSIVLDAFCPETTQYLEFSPRIHQKFTRGGWFFSFGLVPVG
jgi:hypothetical protein